jgi:hypothetical protein
MGMKTRTKETLSLEQEKQTGKIFTAFFQPLAQLASFLSSWVEKSNNPDLGSILLDFKNKKFRIYKKVLNTSSKVSAGLGVIDFQHDLNDGEYAELILYVPLHKLLQSVKYDILADKPSTLKIDEQGKVYLLTKGNTIFLGSEWVNHENLSQSSVIEYMHAVSEKEKENEKKASYILSSPEGLLSLTKLLKIDPLFNTEISLGKIEPSLSYFEGFNEQKPFYHLPSQQEITKTSLMALSYSRMGIILAEIDKEKKIPYDLSDFLYQYILKPTSNPSVDVFFLQDLQNVINSISLYYRDFREDKESPPQPVDIIFKAFNYDYSKFKADEKETITLLSLQTSDDKYFFIFTVPAAFSFPLGNRKQPPSETGLFQIIPKKEDIKGSFTVNKKELLDVLEFWDQIYKAEGKDFVVPLHPISLRVENNILYLESVSGNAGSTSTSLPCEGDNLDVFLLPMNVLLKVLQNPLFDTEEEGEISFSKKEGALSLSILRPNKNLSVAVIAEFII